MIYNEWSLYVSNNQPIEGGDGISRSLGLPDSLRLEVLALLVEVGQ